MSTMETSVLIGALASFILSMITKHVPRAKELWDGMDNGQRQIATLVWTAGIGFAVCLVTAGNVDSETLSHCWKSALSSIVGGVAAFQSTKYISAGEPK